MKCYYSGMLYTLESGIGELYGVGMGVPVLPKGYSLK